MNIAIVGSNRGIGLEFAKQLTPKNNVFCFCRKTSPQLDRITPRKIIEDFDVASETSIKNGLSKLNVNSMDWLIHVSGIMEPTSLENLEVTAIERQFNINAIGPILTSKHFLPLMGTNSKIALLTSRMGSIEDNTSGGAYGYRMSKSALNSAGVSLAQDLKGQEIAVFLLHPGYVKTDMTQFNGHIDTETSVKGMIRVMETKNLRETGTFWHSNGEKLPW